MNTARFLKYVWSYFKIMHERLKFTQSWHLGRANNGSSVVQWGVWLTLDDFSFSFSKMILDMKTFLPVFPVLLDTGTPTLICDIIGLLVIIAFPLKLFFSSRLSVLEKNAQKTDHWQVFIQLISGKFSNLVSHESFCRDSWITVLSQVAGVSSFCMRKDKVIFLTL